MMAMMKKSRERIPVFFHVSDKFCPYMAVTMVSILYNTQAFIEFYIIETGVSEFHKRQIEKIKESYSNFSIEWIKFEYNNVFKKEYFKNLNNNDHENKPWPGVHAFCTPFMPLLKPKIDKFIYLDTDTILLDDISKFYNEDISNHFIGAAPDIVVPLFFNEKTASVNKKIDFLTYGTYFCAGVLLVNAKKFREANIIKKYFLLAKKEIFPACDQDILNRLFQKKGFKPLDLKYDVIYQPTQEQLDKKNIKKSCEIFEKAQREAVIRHFANVKPWAYYKEDWSNRVMSNFEDFWFYAKMTPFYEGISKMFNITTAEYNSQYRSANSIFKTILFGFLPILKVRNINKTKKIYLFNKIHIISIKEN